MPSGGGGTSGFFSTLKLARCLQSLAPPIAAMPVRSKTRRGELGPLYAEKPIRSIQDFSVSDISRLKPPCQPVPAYKSISSNLGHASLSAKC